MDSRHGPLLWSVSPASMNDPTQHFPKSPWSEMTVSREPVPPKPLAVTSRNGVTGSSLVIWNVADSDTPRVVGVVFNDKVDLTPGSER